MYKNKNRNRTNQKVRDALDQYGVNQYDLGEQLGMSENTIYRKLRKELPETEQDRLVSVIRSMKAN